MTLTPGTRLGRFEVRSLLGAGGMGEVYLAYDHDLEREVAVKVLSGTSDPRRFVQEAKAASGLHHPNVAHVYEIGSQDDMRFIAMELVRGETLRDRLSRGAMKVDDAIDISMQIAAALGAAHHAGIVHRDIKPENVIITPDGYVKVLDFGLAKLREMRGEDAATILKTSPGIAMGTIGYMAPEQLLGADVTPAADVFSLGVVMYEMVAGQRPFDDAQAILTKPFAPLRDVPPKLSLVIEKALSKDVAARYASASEVHEALRAISRETPVLVPSKKRTFQSGGFAAAVLGVLVVAAVVAWTVVRSHRRTDALRGVAVAESFVKERRLADAYAMAISAASVLPAEPRVQDLIARTSAKVTIDSAPSGANVYLQRFKGPAQRVAMGMTPLTIPRLARADYILTVEKSGYAPATRTISLMPGYIRSEEFVRDLRPLHVTLIEQSKTPANMVYVEGGPYRLQSYIRPSDRVVDLRGFFIDKLEVTNGEFEQFVRAGGYRQRALWRNPFVDKGKTLPFEEAVSRFHDKTGLPGPRGWSGGVAPAGRENHPVTDITWYEADAFAAWKGKTLPTVYQWERAARPVEVDTALTVFPWGTVSENFDVNDRANFLGQGTLPVDSNPFGASPFGALNMAGNVAEWCRNARPPGYAARGGTFADAAYSFDEVAAYPGFYSAPTLGFRCAIGGGGDEGDFELKPSGYVPVFTPVDDATFQTIRHRYDYDAHAPLNARVVERVETPDWTRETIHFDVNGKNVPAYLYLPKAFRRPLQVIHFAPPGDVVGGYRTLPHSTEVNLGPLIRAGRAVFAVEMEGFLGRPHPAGWVEPDIAREEYVDLNVQYVTEMRRGLDYLDTRPDIDHARVAFLGISAGGGPGVFVTALESRYRAVAFFGSGLSRGDARAIPAASRVNFVPHIAAPKFMLQGRYDEDTPYETQSLPMFKLMREPKRIHVFEGSHIAPMEVMIPAITKFLDETLGPVAQ
jgi:eukaryotic-like serine/threonine-protein kinase